MTTLGRREERRTSAIVKGSGAPAEAKVADTSAEWPLAEPDAELEDLELELLLTGVARRYGYDFRHYAPASLKRRVRRAVAELGTLSISGLLERVLHDPDSLRRLLLILSVHATSMFRDPAFYLALRRRVVPLLKTYPFVRIWHAGCSTGEEVYSLAIMLHEENLHSRCRIYATDISDDLVNHARRGILSCSSLAETERRYAQAGGTGKLDHYFSADSKNAIVREHLRRNIVFSQHNLTSDRSFNEFHLILCRNVMIYFNPALRERVLRLLYESVGMFGVLALGMRESLRFSSVAGLYEEIEPEARLYRRIR
jgi:chemotaxis protein methyltransferase CheR